MTTKGFIYQIFANEDPEMRYIGSSTLTRERERFQQHKKNYNNWKKFPNKTKLMVYDIFEKYGIDKCSWKVIKRYEFVDRKHLLAYETLWQNKLKCINKTIPFQILKNCFKCIHGRRKNDCKECGGSGICVHNKRKDTCKICGGSRICVHNRIKEICKECCGSGICVHDKQKRQCIECSPINCYLCNLKIAGFQNYKRHCKTKTHYDAAMEYQSKTAPF